MLLPYQKASASNIAMEDAADFQKIVESMVYYLQDVQKQPINRDSWAAKILTLVCKDSAFDKVYSFNYTGLDNVAHMLELTEWPKVEYVLGCLSDDSAILGINDNVSTIDGAYDFMRKSFNSHYMSHPVSYDLKGADEVEPAGKRTITIFTYNENSRMEEINRLRMCKFFEDISKV